MANSFQGEIRNRRHLKQWRLRASVALLGLLSARTAIGQVMDANWINPAGGDYDVAANWDTGTVPYAYYDTAHFSLNSGSPYTVNMSSGHIASQIVQDDQVIFDFGGVEVNFSNQFPVFDPVLTVSSNVGQTSSATFEDGTLNLNAPVTLSASGGISTLTLNSFTVLALSDLVGFDIGGGSGITNYIQNDSTLNVTEASFNASNTTIIGSVVSSSSAITFYGNALATATGMSCYGAGAIYAFLDAGTLNFSGSLTAWNGPIVVDGTMNAAGSINAEGSIDVRGKFLTQGATITVMQSLPCEFGGTTVLAGDTHISVSGDATVETGGSLELDSSTWHSTQYLSGSQMIGGWLNLSSGSLLSILSGSRLETITLNGIAGDTINIGLDGSAAAANGQIEIDQLATLAGTLEITLEDGFQPAVGEQFQIFTFGSETGQFSSFDFPAGITFDTSALYTTGMIKVTSVPEPIAMGILACVSLAMLGRRRRPITRCSTSTAGRFGRREVACWFLTGAGDAYR